MFKGTERYFNVPSGVSEYMPLSIIFIQRACLIKDKYGNVKINKRGEILALQRARLISGASQKLTKLKEVKKMKVQYYVKCYSTSFKYLSISSYTLSTLTIWRQCQSEGKTILPFMEALTKSSCAFNHLLASSSNS